MGREELLATGAADGTGTAQPVSHRSFAQRLPVTAGSLRSENRRRSEIRSHAGGAHFHVAGYAACSFRGAHIAGVFVGTARCLLRPTVSLRELAHPMRGQSLTAKDIGENWLGDYPNSPYSAKVFSPAGKTVRLEIRCDELMEPSVKEVTIEKAGLWAVTVRVKWNFRALRQCTQVHPVNITWNLSVDGKALPSQTRTVLVQPVDVMPLRYTSPSGLVIDCTHFLAAYANEDHPMFDAILKEALDTRVLSHFDGMLSQDPNQVISQVLAIWWALEKRGIVYSDISGPVTPGNAVFTSQRIRFFDDVIQSRQANCIDGTLVFASLLRRIGLQPLICLVPGHAFSASISTAPGKGGASGDDRAQQPLRLCRRREGPRQFIRASEAQSVHGLRPETLTCPATRELAEEISSSR